MDATPALKGEEDLNRRERVSEPVREWQDDGCVGSTKMASDHHITTAVTALAGRKLCVTDVFEWSPQPLNLSWVELCVA